MFPRQEIEKAEQIKVDYFFEKETKGDENVYIGRTDR